MSMSSLFIATLPNQNYEKQDSELQNSTGFGTDGTKKQDYLEENRTLKRKKQDFDVRNSTEFGTDCKTDSIKETIIDIIRANPESSYSDLVSKTGVSRRTIAKVIKDLSDAAIIKRQGSRRNGAWFIDK